MKRSIFLICMVLCLLLCACGYKEATPQFQTPESTQESTTEPTTESTEPTTESTEPDPYGSRINSAFAPYETDDINFAVLLNEPFEQELTPTVTWNEGEFDRLYIIPKYIGSRVDVFEILWDEEGNMSYGAETTYSTVVEDGCIIYASLPRPEGMPRWEVRVITSTAVASMELTYNGNTGTPAKEYITNITGLFYKPVIYLYPEVEAEVAVELDLHGELTCTYPAYNGGWFVTAQPDGTLTDASGQTYNYLYWEGECDTTYDFSQGFCVKGEDTAAFLEDSLAKLGLNRREANEFIH